MFAVGYTQMNTLHGLVKQVGKVRPSQLLTIMLNIVTGVASDFCQLNAKLLYTLRYLQGLSSANVAVAVPSLQTAALGLTQVNQMPDLIAVPEPSRRLCTLWI